MKLHKFPRPGSIILLIVGLLFIAAQAFAVEDFFLYGNQGESDITTSRLIQAGGGEAGAFSWFTAVDYFRSGPYKGRMIAATGTKIYMQSATDPESWTEIGSVTYCMDPAFIKVSPDGNKIALGMAYGAPLLILPSSVCENTSAVTLIEKEDPEDPDSEWVLAPGITAYDENYYDAAWAPDNRHLVINGGKWPGPDYGSGVISLDTQTGATTGLIAAIPGASASIAVDSNYNLVTGIGMATNPTNRTGELKVWTSPEWWNGGAMISGQYEDQLRVVATNALSSAYLGFDTDGNLCVGGGDAFGVGGPTENGYAAIIHHRVMERVVNTQPGQAAPVDETNGAEYRQFAPDPCQNDTATGILAFDGGITVSWNPTNSSCNQGAADDNWNPGVTANLTTYTINGARDGDGDGHPDISDHSPGTYDQSNIDSDGDGYGNIIDADFDNNGVVNMADFGLFNAHWMETAENSPFDMNSDGKTNMADFGMLNGHWMQQEPYYNTK